MKSFDFELIPVDKDEFEEIMRKSKNHRFRKRKVVKVDPIEQQYNWDKFGFRLVIVDNKVITEYKK